MPINSRAKGVRGEHLARDLLRKYGFEARRGQQFSGGGDSPDVVHNMPGFHIEVKFVQAGNPYNWLAQAERDKKPGLDALVLHKRNNKPFLAIMDGDAFVALIAGLLATKGDDA